LFASYLQFCTDVNNWKQACLELAGLDGYVSEVDEQRCSEHAQAMYSYALQECQSNLLQIYRPRIE
jgi:hypothetical protein